MDVESHTRSRGSALLMVLPLGFVACTGGVYDDYDGFGSNPQPSVVGDSTGAATSGDGSTAAPTDAGTGGGDSDPNNDGTGDETSTSAGTSPGTSPGTGPGTGPGTSDGTGDDTGDGTSGGPTNDGIDVPDPVFGDPIIVGPQDLEKWIWVPIPAMHCADGLSTAGVMVNFTAKSPDLLLFFQGGGACWDAVSCAAQVQNLTPWQFDPFGAWGADGGPVNVGVFDRFDPGNPLRNHNYVYVPYCTGDGHIGSKISDYGVHHVGYLNALHALERVVPTFLGANQIVVAGFSAGGIAATGNYHQVASAFESFGKKVDVVINDAGPFVRPPYLTKATLEMLRDSWGLNKTILPWCPDCETEGAHAIYRTQAELHPGVRSSLICAYNDSVVRLLYAALLSPVELGLLELGLRDLGTWRDQIAGQVAPGRLREFYYFGDRHGATEVPLFQSPGLAQFLQAQIYNDPNWGSVRP